MKQRFVIRAFLLLGREVRTMRSLIPALILIGVVLGCGGGQTCTADLTIDGKTHTGTASDAEQARQNSCSKYCIEGNPEFDRAYEKWLETPEAQKVPDRNSKWAAQAESKELAAIVERCQKKCAADVASGKLKPNVKCN